MIQFCLIAVLAFFAVFFYSVIKLHQDIKFEIHGWKSKKALI
jgi:hypothetical protein